MVTRLILNEELEKDSRLACKKCYHILVRKPIIREAQVRLSMFKVEKKVKRTHLLVDQTCYLMFSLAAKISPKYQTHVTRCNSSCEYKFVV